MKNVFIDLASLREAFDLQSNAGQSDDDTEKAATAEAALQVLVRQLKATPAQILETAAQGYSKQRGELADLKNKLAFANILLQERKAEIERLHELCRASAAQVPSIRTVLRLWIASLAWSGLKRRRSNKGLRSGRAPVL